MSGGVLFMPVVRWAAARRAPQVDETAAALIPGILDTGRYHPV